MASWVLRPPYPRKHVGETSGNDVLDRELIAEFDDLWQRATPLPADVVERYAAVVATVVDLRYLEDGEALRCRDNRQGLYRLHSLYLAGESRGLRRCNRNRRILESHRRR